jgi:hypothetical protein
MDERAHSTVIILIDRKERKKSLTVACSWEKNVCNIN